MIQFLDHILSNAQPTGEFDTTNASFFVNISETQHFGISVRLAINIYSLFRSCPESMSLYLLWCLSFVVVYFGYSPDFEASALPIR
jgi:hypothetical protein